MEVVLGCPSGFPVSQPNAAKADGLLRNRRGDILACGGATRPGSAGVQD